MEEKRTRDNAIRAIIRTARERHGFQEKDVNEAFHQILTGKGIKAPRAIMTRVRDKRRPLEFTKAEAAALAHVLKIDPSPLMPAEAQASLLRDENEDAVMVQPAENKATSGTDEGAGTGDPGRVAAATQREEVPKFSPEQECMNRITVSPSAKGLMLQIDYIMTEVQLDRFTLAIPAYMTRQDQMPPGMRVRAQVEIFPYQAELIMRAIFGRR